MKLTAERKAHIDSLSYHQMLSKWRHSPIGDAWFQDETGDYWSQRMKELRDTPDGQSEHVAANKSIGW